MMKASGAEVRPNAIVRKILKTRYMKSQRKSMYCDELEKEYVW